MSNDKQNPRLAVLIDADNTFKVIDMIDELFEEISKFGDASVRRIYGDWTKENMKRWKEVLPKHAIQPIQQYANTTGKNATDSALGLVGELTLTYNKARQQAITSELLDIAGGAEALRRVAA